MLKTSYRAKRAILPREHIKEYIRRGYGTEYIAALYGVTETTVNQYMSDNEPGTYARHTFIDSNLLKPRFSDG